LNDVGLESVADDLVYEDSTHTRRENDRILSRLGPSRIDPLVQTPADPLGKVFHQLRPVGSLVVKCCLDRDARRPPAAGSEPEVRTRAAVARHRVTRPRDPDPLIDSDPASRSVDSRELVLDGGEELFQKKCGLGSGNDP